MLFLRQRVELGTRERQRDPKSFDKQEKSLLFDKSREEPSSDKNSFDMKQNSAFLSLNSLLHSFILLKIIQ